MKKILSVFLGLVLALALYCGAWQFMAYKMNQAITDFYTVDAPLKGIKLHGPMPVVTGFPFTPVITYTKGVSTEDFDLQFSSVTLQGFPIPKFPLTINFNQGLLITSLQTKYSLPLDALNATIIVPSSLPNSSREADIKTWQASQENIDIENIQAKKSGMDLKAEGTIGLNTQLQPTLNLNSVIEGHEQLISFLVETGELKPLPAAIALSALNAMVKTDEQTGSRQVKLAIKIKDQVLYLGPVRLTTLPPIRWP
ncbi:MAG TPA: DUF2125 domain-containing protein [Alphaproteobacteria bacterium]|nr:DUF2125 domain-containing protein [Alphaproteobacteria bacterium]